MIVHDSPSKPMLKVGDIATEARVGVQTLHFYERLGLLPKPQRSPSNHRVYSTEALRRLRFIKKAQAVGFTLEEIKEIFQCGQQGAERCRHVAELGKKRLHELDAELRMLRAFRKSLAAALPKWNKENSSRDKCAGEFCDLIERLPLAPASPAEPRRNIRH
jgi:DNA-binding transcriptional MerR regulator